MCSRSGAGAHFRKRRRATLDEVTALFSQYLCVGLSIMRTLVPQFSAITLTGTQPSIAWET
jgi:hypothetical protein